MTGLKSLLVCSFFTLFVLICADDPLILTEYLAKGDLDGGRNAAFVQLVDGVPSYSGYFTVNAEYNSNMFFWYFPCKKSSAVTIWLQGGPGSSSMFGLFYENGPLMMKNGQVVKRQHAWSDETAMIYIDNPVGTGFSFTNSTEGYVTNETQVGDQLYSLLQQFFQLFPELQDHRFYITGESYGGKYVPALAYAIHTKNPTAKIKINLKGIAMGNGFSDPVHMNNYGDYLYQIGLLDDQAKKQFHVAEKYINTLINQSKFDEANDATNILIGNGPGSLFSNLTGIESYYNYYNPSDNGSDEEMENFFKNQTTRKLIHVGQTPYGTQSSMVQKYLAADIMQSIAPKLKTIADNYRVIFYNGQLDIIVAYPLTVNFLRHFDWCGHQQYMVTGRSQWRVGKELAGYVRTVNPESCIGSVTEILVRNAGHMVPQDQPTWALDILKKLVNNQHF